MSPSSTTHVLQKLPPASDFSWQGHNLGISGQLGLRRVIDTAPGQGSGSLKVEEELRSGIISIGPSCTAQDMNSLTLPRLRGHQIGAVLEICSEHILDGRRDGESISAYEKRGVDLLCELNTVLAAHPSMDRTQLASWMHRAKMERWYLSEALMNGLKAGEELADLMTPRMRAIAGRFETEPKTKVLNDRSISLSPGEALVISRFLKVRDIMVEPWHFVIVFGKWQATDELGVPFRRSAMTEALCALAKKNEIQDTATKVGFARLLPLLTRRNLKQTRPWSKKVGMESCIADGYANSHHDAVLDVLGNHHLFAKIKAIGVKPHDFPSAPKNYWVDPKGNPTPATIEVFGQALDVLRKQLGVKEPKSKGELNQFLPRWTVNFLRNVIISPWGTTPMTALAQAFGDNPGDALRCVVMNQNRFRAIAQQGIQDTDLGSVPQETWSIKGIPTPSARSIIDQWLSRLAQACDADATTVEGFRKVLPKLSITEARKFGLAKLPSALSGAYKNHTLSALQDLFRHDAKYHRIAALKLQPWDMPRRKNGFWRTAEGKPSKEAVKALDLLCQRIATQRTLDLSKESDVTCLATALRNETNIFRLPVNDLGSNVYAAFRHGFRKDREAVIRTLFPRLVA